MDIGLIINKIGSYLPWPFWINHIFIALAIMAVFIPLTHDALASAFAAAFFYIGREFQQSAYENQPWKEAAFDAGIPCAAVALVVITATLI